MAVNSRGIKMSIAFDQATTIPGNLSKEESQRKQKQQPYMCGNIGHIIYLLTPHTQEPKQSKHCLKRGKDEEQGHFSVNNSMPMQGKLLKLSEISMKIIKQYGGTQNNKIRIMIWPNDANSG